MFAKPFNPKRPFGTVHGLPGVAFDQDGQLYAHDHYPVDLNGARLKLAPVAEAPKEPAPVKTEAPPADPGEDDDTPADEKVDLLAWAQGHPDAYALPWQAVRAAAADVLEDISDLKSKAALKEAILKHYGTEV